MSTEKDPNELKSFQPKKDGGKKSNAIAIIAAILAIMVIVQGVKIYLDYQDKKEKDERIESTESELQTMTQRMDEISSELDDKIAEIERLGGDITELEEAKAELEKEREQLQKSGRAGRKKIKLLSNKVEGYEQLLKAKDEEIVRLKAVNEELSDENVTLKEEKNELNAALTEASEEKEKLTDKVAIASELKVENVGILAVNSKGKEKTSPFRNRQLDKLKVTFNIAENKVAPIEGKEILIRIIDANGQVIFDVANGSGTFMLDDKEAFYTASQEILFDNSRQQVTFLYDKGSEYEKGDYVMEVYTDDYLMGKAAFTVR